MQNMRVTRGTCPACDTDVLWVGSPTTQQRAFNVDAEQRYLLDVDGPHLVEVHVSHFDTCSAGTSRRRLAETVNRAAPSVRNGR